MTVEPGWPQRVATQAAGTGGFVGPRAKLMGAGLELLFERGDSSYTVDELVRRAHVTLKTFYRCFATKDEFLLAVFTAAVAGATPRTRERILAKGRDPLDRLRLAVVWPLEWHRATDRASRVIAHEHMRIALTSPETIAQAGKAYEELLRELAVAATEAGQIRPVDLDWDVHIINRMITTAFHGLVLHMGEPEHGSLADNVWRFCLTALGGRPVTTGR